MKSQIEKSKRRRKLQGKKKYIIAAVLLFLGIPASIISFELIAHAMQPLYVSPLPFIRDFQVNAATDDDTVRNKISAELRKQHIPFMRIDTSEENAYSIQLSDGEHVFVTKNKDISIQIASLQVIYNRLTMEGKRFKKLDLRFSKPVITF
jgi:hypothetical protein